MRIIYYNKISRSSFEAEITRPALKSSVIEKTVLSILKDVKSNGHSAVIKYSRLYDGLKSNSNKLSLDQIKKEASKLDTQTIQAIDTAFNNIFKFHKRQRPINYSVRTMPGVSCSRKYLPIQNVGLYIPGGSAVLVSTMLMLGIPATIAGVKRIVVTTPIGSKRIEPALAYSILKCGVTEVYNCGGAQAVAMLAYGTEKVKKVEKIFGPGNQYVTAAKSFVSIDPVGCAIDMPAGPSEVLIISDKNAKPDFIAADLLSQAEHGPDSQVIFITDSIDLAENVLKEINSQILDLPRKSIAEKCLENSLIIIVDKIDKAIEISNNYAPEHLILNLKNPQKYINRITNAGSVFIGKYSPESVGDYASGTNHSLPTYGYAKSFSGVNVESFMKTVSFQNLSLNGLKNISKTVIKLAETEKLQAHANAVKIRLSK